MRTVLDCTVHFIGNTIRFRLRLYLLQWNSKLKSMYERYWGHFMEFSTEQMCVSVIFVFFIYRKGQFFQLNWNFDRSKRVDKLHRSNIYFQINEREKKQRPSKNKLKWKKTAKISWQKRSEVVDRSQVGEKCFCIWWE